MRHGQRKPETLFIVTNLAIRPSQFRRPFKNTALQLFFRQPEFFLDFLAFADFLMQCFDGSLQRLRCSKEIRKNCNFGSENIRIDRLIQVVNPAHAICLKYVLLIKRMCGKEENRHVLVPLACFDQLGEFEAVRTRHFDVQDDRRELVMKESEQRLIGRPCADKAATTGFQYGFKSVEVPFFIIDEEQLNNFIQQIFQPLYIRWKPTTLSRLGSFANSLQTHHVLFGAGILAQVQCCGHQGICPFILEIATVGPRGLAISVFRRGPTERHRTTASLPTQKQRYSDQGL